MDVGEPSSYEDATTSPDVDTWLLDMQSEMNSIKENNTWDLVELPTGMGLEGSHCPANGSSDTNMYPIQRSSDIKLGLLPKVSTTMRYSHR